MRRANLVGDVRRTLATMRYSVQECLANLWLSVEYSQAPTCLASSLLLHCLFGLQCLNWSRNRQEAFLLRVDGHRTTPGNEDGPGDLYHFTSSSTFDFKCFRSMPNPREQGRTSRIQRSNNTAIMDLHCWEVEAHGSSFPLSLDDMVHVQRHTSIT